MVTINYYLIMTKEDAEIRDEARQLIILRPFEPYTKRLREDVVDYLEDHDRSYETDIGQVVLGNRTDYRVDRVRLAEAVHDGVFTLEALFKRGVLNPDPNILLAVMREMKKDPGSYLLPNQVTVLRTKPDVKLSDELIERMFPAIYRAYKAAVRSASQ